MFDGLVLSPIHNQVSDQLRGEWREQHAVPIMARRIDQSVRALRWSEERESVRRGGTQADARFEEADLAQLERTKASMPGIVHELIFHPNARLASTWQPWDGILGPPMPAGELAA